MVDTNHRIRHFDFVWPKCAIIESVFLKFREIPEVTTSAEFLFTESEATDRSNYRIAALNSFLENPQENHTQTYSNNSSTTADELFECF